ncbi:ABC transporter ATP-binding protein [Paenibacillaceae bacterium WGS1546]|uniref:ABC transporter ATP-binding protein n=1 Tax=Cohnella sp. WGS1546 TaxID=3366810 RepID=UPI00372D6962
MLLEGTGLGFRYGKASWLFRNLNIAVAAGEAVGLSGPSGCGKSTLGRILSGYLTPVEGTVALNGQAPPARGRHPVQLAFQHPERSVNPRWRMKRVLEEGGGADPALLDALGIQDSWLGRTPNECSGGELQRVCIARALAGPTRFLIADEMTTMLDAVTQAQIWQAVLAIARDRGLGLLVISHDEPLIRRLCDRRLRLEAPIG